jgi:hypothetical protein
MESMRLAHVLLLSAWGGLVLAEAVVEVAARDDEGLRRAARLHFWIDVLVEAPLLFAVLATGTVLATRVHPWTPTHWVKIFAGLVAVSANLYCVAVVVLRHVRAANDSELRKLSARIRLVAPAIGLPAAALAAWIGFTRFFG